MKGTGQPFSNWWGLTPSMFLVFTWKHVWLIGALTWVPKQWGTEDANDAQVQEEAQGQCPYRTQEGRKRPLGDEPGTAGGHVGQYGFHLKVGAHHGTDVKELVTVTCLIEGEDRNRE